MSGLIQWVCSDSAYKGTDDRCGRNTIPLFVYTLLEPSRSRTCHVWHRKKHPRLDVNSPENLESLLALVKRTVTAVDERNFSSEISAFSVEYLRTCKRANNTYQHRVLSEQTMTRRFLESCTHIQPPQTPSGPHVTEISALQDVGSAPFSLSLSLFLSIYIYINVSNYTLALFLFF